MMTLFSFHAELSL